MSRVLSLALAIVAVACAARAEARTNLILTAPFAPVAAWDGVVAMNDYDRVSGTFSLWTYENGMREHLRGERPVGYDVAVGPGPDGNPLIAYSSCKTARADSIGRTRRLGGCDVVVLRPSGDAIDPPADATAAGTSQIHAAVWRDRMAWVSRAEERRARETVFTARLGDAHAERTPILQGLPRGSHVEDLDLEDDNIAVVVSIPSRMDASARRTEVRAGRLNGPVLRYASSQEGRSGVRYVGVAIQDGRLAFARTCTRSARACQGRHGIFRVRLGREAFSLAWAPIRIGSFDQFGDTAYWTTADLTRPGGCPRGGCVAQEVRNVRFRPANRSP